MIKIILPLVFIILSSNSFSQIGIGTTNPESSSILDLSSDTKGFLPPRMDDSEKLAINNPAEGLLIYNTTENCIEYFSNMDWVSLCTTDSNQIKVYNSQNFILTNSGGGVNGSSPWSAGDYLMGQPNEIGSSNGEAKFKLINNGGLSVSNLKYMDDDNELSDFNGDNSQQIGQNDPFNNGSNLNGSIIYSRYTFTIKDDITGLSIKIYPIFNGNQVDFLNGSMALNNLLWASDTNLIYNRNYTLENGINNIDIDGTVNYQNLYR